MSDELTPQNMLRLYRERSPQDLTAQVKELRKMPERDRSELLFFMICHVTMALQQQGGAPSVAFDDVQRAVRGDA